MTATSKEERLTELWATPHTWYDRLGSVDHKIIGMRYLVTALIFLVLGGIEALVMRIQLSHADAGVVSAEAYAQLFTMHGLTMMFLFALPVLSGFSNYLWPLLLGARDMALPRINALSYWLFVAAGVLLYSSVPFGLAPNAGWFNYVPLASGTFLPRSGIDFYALSLILLGISTTVGAVNFVVTFVRMRAPGMTLDRVPVVIWGTLTASVAVLFAIPALTLDCLLLYADRQLGTHFLDVGLGGDPMLWQQLFWIFGHPWVYIVVLPSMGMASQIIPTFCRRPLVAYRAVVGATIAVCAIGFIVWAHHMFATGLPNQVMAFFSAASLLITIPSAVSVFAWVATIWLGRPVVRTPFLFMLGFLFTFMIGGVSGVMTGSAPFDWQLTQTYFVVGHLHYVLIGINLFPVVGGLYYWFPKFTGRLMRERIGWLSFWMMFIGFNVGFFPMHIVGMLGMPRRIYTYLPGQGWDGWNLLITVGSFLFAVGLLVTFAEMFRARRHGAVAGANPWQASTLEWSVSSPPPAHNFTSIPQVASRDPLWEHADEPVHTRLHEGPALDEGHQAMSTTARSAEVIGAVSMPERSRMPLYLSVAVLGIFEALLWRQWLLVLIMLIATVIAVGAWLWPRVGADHDTSPLPDDRHPIGQWAMSLTIATEAALFAGLFFTWFYLKHHSAIWPVHTPPELLMPGINTVILLASSAVLHWGHRGGAQPRRGVITLTMLLGLVFLALQVREYGRLSFLPTTDAYGSSFYTITGIHGAHVLVGLLLLGYLVLTTGRTPRRAVTDRRWLSNVSLYWHFVDVIWLLVFGVLYVLPHLTS